MIVAAGRGTRAAAGLSVPKQYAQAGGIAIMGWSLRTFEAHPEIARIQVVIQPDDRPLYDRSTAGTSRKLRAPVSGGATRQASVLAGLEALSDENPDAVLIHDAARPFVGSSIITRVLAALATHSGAIAAVPLADTLKRATPTGTIGATLDRKGLWRAQTPQAFKFADILGAHRNAARHGRSDFTDDAAVAEWAGLSVALIEDTADNSKVTTADDLREADIRLGGIMEPRTGTGFDVHRFTDGASVWLCGVEIPHTHRLEGHSDADVGLHALTDALLGAIGDGDIGQHFPPSDPQWRGAPSRLFLEDAARRVRMRGGRIANVDVTLLCEAPRIGPHRPQMQSVIAEILGLGPDRVGIKATTTEGLGFTGRREGIAAMASALVMLPASN
ncbi:MAG: bifunctional 2-C-methyl-D-erythritol 4-phosphate cytidylyltransferase/2-C-methyl-D-erythritol 2,4-cyclodiphosphate synthase [Hyphomicrobium sp.]|nr:bifunctional 2-C-methyl-D-erythritol 4-phosphate cytidylyltransferase/2-C-methyl-D-erythritol 2,4-cyclodiphosphate synthase [Hyphomicrobium sp.]